MGIIIVEHFIWYMFDKWFYYIWIINIGDYKKCLKQKEKIDLWINTFNKSQSNILLTNTIVCI